MIMMNELLIKGVVLHSRISNLEPQSLGMRRSTQKVRRIVGALIVRNVGIPRRFGSR